jgi:hypothetical protein
MSRRLIPEIGLASKATEDRLPRFTGIQERQNG